MSKFRTMVPGPDYPVAHSMFSKIQKTLLLCKILQNSTFKHLSAKEETGSFFSDYLDISEALESCKQEHISSHFKVYKNGILITRDS